MSEDERDLAVNITIIIIILIESTMDAICRGKGGTKSRLFPTEDTHFFVPFAIALCLYRSLHQPQI